jgi:hypothetical protein
VVANKYLGEVESPEDPAAAADAARSLSDAARVVNFLCRHIRLLELMVMDDYHSVRVSLRGASGAQSQGAFMFAQRLSRVARIVSGGLDAAGLTPLRIYRDPRGLATFNRLLKAMAILETAYADFFHIHYRLALLVQSSRGVGALGNGIGYLAKRFLEPLFPELDEARFNHLIISNLQHAMLSGAMFNDLPLYSADSAVAEGWQPYPSKSYKPIQELTRLYFSCFRSGDIDTWIELFEPEAFVEDPPGSRKHTGRQELVSYFRNTVAGFRCVSYKVTGLKIREAVAEVSWSASGQTYTNELHSFDGTAHFWINARNRVLGVRVDWSPGRLADDLVSELRG